MKTVLCAYNAKFIHMNLALRYLKANMTCNQEHTKIMEFTIKDPILHTAAKIISESPEIVAFSCYLWNIESVLKTAQIIKKALPNTIVILGGPEVSFDSEEWFQKENSIDIIIEGEGEITFSKIIEAYLYTQPLSEVLGIVYKDQKGIIHRSKKRPPLNVQTLKSPYHFEEDLATLSKRIVYFETSRGCPFNCHFCLSSTEQGVRFFNMDERKNELKYLIENGAKTIKFLDRTFNTNVTYALDIFSFLIQNHRAGNVFQFEITGDILKPEVIDYLNQHAPKGLFRFEIGVQSTHDETNLLVNRRQNFENLKNNILRIQNGGKIDLHLDLIAGLPKEDYQRFQKTFNDVFELRPAELQFGFLKMLRGTPLRQKAADFDYVYVDFAPYEIISNHVLSFGDLLRMKQTEDVLEKYWNSGKFKQAVTYCVETIFETAWDFFSTFGIFWHKRGWSTIGHQHLDLFTRLLEFIECYSPMHRNILHNIMLLDYYEHFQYKPKHLKEYQNFSKEERKKLFAALDKKLATAHISLGKNIDLTKHTQIEHCEIDLEEWLENHNIVPKENELCVVYHPTTRQVLKYFISSEVMA